MIRNIMTKIGKPKSRRKVTVLMVLMFIKSLVSMQSREPVLDFVFLFLMMSRREYKATTQKGYIMVKIIQTSIIFIKTVIGSEWDTPMKL